MCIWCRVQSTDIFTYSGAIYDVLRFLALSIIIWCVTFFMLAYCTHCTRSRNVTSQRIDDSVFFLFSSSLTLQSSISLSHSRSPDLFNVSLITLSALFIRCITNILAAYTFTALLSLRLWQFQCKCMLFIWLKHK